MSVPVVSLLWPENGGIEAGLNWVVEFELCRFVGDCRSEGGFAGDTLREGLKDPVVLLGCTPGV